jgi:hypothetical protein
MKIPKQACTKEFKELMVRRFKDGQSVGLFLPDEMELICTISLFSSTTFLEYCTKRLLINLPV